MASPERVLSVDDPVALRALAHPLRLQLLGLVRERAPVTGAELAELAGESTASVSYHLSVLARYGFVEPDPRPARTRRHKPWRPAFDVLRISSAPGDSPASATVEGAVLANLLGIARREQDDYLAGSSPLPDGWRDVGAFSMSHLALTAAESEQLAADVGAVLDRYRDRASEGDELARFSVSFVAIPTSVVDQR